MYIIKNIYFFHGKSNGIHLISQIFVNSMRSMVPSLTLLPVYHVVYENRGILRGCCTWASEGRVVLVWLAARACSTARSRCQGVHGPCMALINFMSRPLKSQVVVISGQLANEGLACLF